jgi:hypothetical protein
VKASVVVEVGSDGSIRLVVGGPKQPVADAPASSALAGDGLRRRPRAAKTGSNRQGSGSLAATGSRTDHVGRLGGQTLPVHGPETELRHIFHAMPSPALREACGCFENAVRAAVETVNAAAVAAAELGNLNINGCSARSRSEDQTGEDTLDESVGCQ